MFIRRTLRGLGYDVRPYQAHYFPDVQLTALLRSLKVNLVLDVGANSGQFGKSLREHGYAGRIVSFEPLEAARKGLLDATGGDPQWQVAERCAIGERDGVLDINVSQNSVSSSALQMLDAHLRTAPDSRYVATERVPLRRLDTCALQYLDAASVALLKIDTQGYEDRVLDGAAGILDRISTVQLEISLVPLYAGQRLFPEMLQRMLALNFEVWAMWPVLVDPDSGRLLQVDATFVRPADRSAAALKSS
jgi:FkbM family methyltransferase